MYVGALTSLRLQFPLVDPGNGETYQKMLCLAKRICQNHAAVTGANEIANDAFIDVLKIEPHDSRILQALAERCDRDLYHLCSLRLSSHPTVIVKSLVQMIRRRSGRRLIPQFNMDWMLVYALRRYIKEMPKPCIQNMLKKLDQDDIYALVYYLYPLGMDLKTWWHNGLSLNIVNSNGDSLVHLVVKYIDHIQWRCQLSRLDGLVQEAAFTDADRLITHLHKNQFLSLVSSFLSHKPSALPCDIENVARSVEDLAEEFKRLGGRATPELVSVAASCDNLVRTTQTVAHGKENRKRSLSNPNEDETLLKRVKRDIIAPHSERAIEDLKLLKLVGQIHSPGSDGQTADQIVYRNRRRYSLELIEKIEEIFEPPQMGSQ